MAESSEVGCSCAKPSNSVFSMSLWAFAPGLDILSRAGAETYLAAISTLRLRSTKEILGSSVLRRQVQENIQCRPFFFLLILPQTVRVSYNDPLRFATSTLSFGKCSPAAMSLTQQFMASCGFGVTGSCSDTRY